MSPRSLLFVPGNRPERFQKAVATGADQVIIDLEDAVDPQAKIAARDYSVAFLNAYNTDRRILVRVNGVETPWHADDVDALIGLAGLAGFILPKAETAEPLVGLRARLHPDQHLVALVETVRGVLDLRRVCAVPGLSQIAFGAADFCLDSAIADGGELDGVLLSLVLESRYAGLPAPIDGVTMDVADMSVLEADIVRSRRFGFGGKLCIHPNQVGPVNAGYLPSLHEREWAQRVVDAAARGFGATTIDGKLVDAPVLERARLTLLQAAKTLPPAPQGAGS